MWTDRRTIGTNAGRSLCCDSRVPRDPDELPNLVRALDLDVHRVGICHACLSFVSFPLDEGDEAEVRRALRHFAPVLWSEGLALPLQAALECARRDGVPGAEEAIADVRARGARASVVRPVIRRLAADLNRSSKALLRECGLIEETPVIRLRTPLDRR